MSDRFVKRWMGAILVLALATGMAVAADPVPWRSGAAAVPEQSISERVAAVQQLAGRSDEQHLLVQFDRPLTEADRAAFEASGAQLLSYVGANAYFASFRDAGANVRAVGELPYLSGVTSIDSRWKTAPSIVAGRVPSHVVVTPADSAEAEIVALYVTFHGDVDLLTTGVDLVKAHGARVVDELESVNGLVIELPRAQVSRLADEDAVQWIEWPLPPFSELNNSNRSITQANTVQGLYGLDGTGVNVLVYDGGYALQSHGDFGGRLTVRDSSGLSDHSTHVAGTIGGDGSGSSGTYRGMAPGVTMQSYGFEYGGGGVFLYSNPGDLESDYGQAINLQGVDISNNSIGTNTATNGFDCDITGDYGVTSQLIDTIVRGDGSNPTFDEPFRVIWANGNERQTSRCGSTYNTTAPPACAKNHITVGALNSNDDSVTSFTSWGPADDGRLKPDISAPGCQSNDDGGVTSCSSSGGYTVKCGTSMASPTVCGLSALLIEDYRNQFPGQPLFRNSTLKAWFAHTASDGGNTGPDYQYGYGSVRVESAMLLMRSGAFVEQELSQGQSFVRTVTVNAGDPELKVTLAWDDYPGTPNSNPALVNDLDLIVTGPSGFQSYPWTLDPSNPSAVAGQNQADHINNIEQVQVANPQAGVWTIEVYGYNVPQGPQPFSLVGDGASNVRTVISFPNGLPDTVPPGTPQTVNVEVATYGESLVAGSPTLYYRASGGSFQSTPLTFISGTLYQATLPAAVCSDTPEYYFSAEGDVSGLVTSPSDAPASVYGYDIGEFTVYFTDSFETDQGWTVYNGATTGNWERADPQAVDSSGTTTQPEDDHTTAGTLCYVTGPLAGSSAGSYDVDGGPTYLTSPTFDLAGADATVSYWRWYHISTQLDDQLTVEISNNNGSSWTTVEAITTRQTWTYAEWQVSDFVTPTSQMKVRFTADDSPNNSLVEALIDDFRVDAFTCQSDPPEACCYPDGSCLEAAPDVCTGAGGTPQGSGTDCNSVSCPQPAQACCFTDGSCQDLEPTECGNQGGVAQGGGTDCASTYCDVTDPRTLDISFVPEVDPNSVCPGQTFNVDVHLAAPTGDLQDVRLLQLDARLSSNLTVNSVTFDLPVDGMFLYLTSTGTPGGVVQAAYTESYRVSGYIVDLDATPDLVAHYNVTYAGGNAELHLLGALGDPIDVGARFRVGFDPVLMISLDDGNLTGGTLGFTEGGCGDLHIVASDPGDGWIDARVPADPSTADPEGWSVIDVTFNAEATGLQPSDFTLSEICDAGECDGVAPSVASVLPVTATEVQLLLDRPLDPKTWTTVTFVPGDASDVVRLGFLPADVDNSGTSNTFDVLALIDRVNEAFGGGSPAVYQSDIDRSGTINLSDILVAVDLLNGAAPYEAYLGKTLPAMP